MFTPPGATPSAADSTAIEGERVRPSFERKSPAENHAAHRNFNLYFLVPIMLIVATAMAALVGGTLWLTTLQNRAEAAKERDEVKASFVAGVEAIKATNRTFAVWDEAAERLVNTFDVNWADANEGAYVHDQNGIESTFVVEQSGKVKWGHVDGQRSTVDPVALLGPGYATAIRQIILARPHGYEPLGGISLSARGSAIFSIFRIRAHGPAFKATSAANRYLVMAKFIDSGWIHQIPRAANGAPLSFETRPPAGYSSWTIKSYDGRGERSLVWVPSQPGTRLLYDVIPVLLALISLISALAALVLWRARTAARELMASETKALYVASRDALTGLPNRRSFSVHLLSLHQRSEKYSIMFLDLDGFKRINDTFGHGVGDKLLCRTGERLQRVLPERAFLARLGGDEFAIALPKPRLLSELEVLATQLIEAVNEPHRFGGEPTMVGVTVGIAANEAGEYDEVMRHADTAMYVAKQRGRNRWQHYVPSLEEGAQSGGSLRST